MKREERETYIHHDIPCGIIEVTSTERAIWRRCEHIGLTLQTSTRGPSDDQIRTYFGPFSDFGFSIRARSRKEKDNSKKPTSTGG